MNKIKIIFTIDTENPQTPLYQKKFSDNRIWSNGAGIEKIVALLNEFSIIATFFVNIYEYKVWGGNEIRRILRFLDEKGQDVQLHTHPIWTDLKRREFMHQYSFEEQKAIIKFGKEFIEDAIGKQVNSHRAGGYGFNENTLNACIENNILIDSSNFYGHPNCQTVITKNKVVEKNGLFEIPITSFRLNGKISKLDINWLAYDDLEKVLKRFSENRETDVLNIMFHSYSLTESKDGYSSFEYSPVKENQLRNLLKFIKNYKVFEPVNLVNAVSNGGDQTGSLNEIKHDSRPASLHIPKKQIVFVKKIPQIRIFKQAFALKKMYPEYEIVLVANIIDRELFEPVFDKIIQFNNSAELKSIISKLSPMLFHAHGEPNMEPAIVMQITHFPVIYDVYDFSGIRYGVEKLSPEDRENEKYVLENADAIVFKFPQNILNYYRELGYKIEVPVLTYLDYCLPEYFANAEPVNGPFQLTYAGVLNSSVLPAYKYGNNQYIEIVKEIISQKIGFNIYINKWQIESEDMYADYIALSKQTDYFKFNFALPQVALQNKIASDHFGCSLHNFQITEHHPLFGQTSIGNKLSTYLEAGLPVIVSSNLKYNTQVVEDLGVGFGIPLNQLSDLGRKLNEIDYAGIKRRVLQVREYEFSAFNNIHRLMEFYKNTVNQ